MDSSIIVCSIHVKQFMLEFAESLFVSMGNTPFGHKHESHSGGIQCFLVFTMDVIIIFFGWIVGNDFTVDWMAGASVSVLLISKNEWIHESNQMENILANDSCGKTCASMTIVKHRQLSPHAKSPLVNFLQSVVRIKQIHGHFLASFMIFLTKEILIMFSNVLSLMTSNDS